MYLILVKMEINIGVEGQKVNLLLQCNSVGDEIIRNPDVCLLSELLASESLVKELL